MNWLTGAFLAILIILHHLSIGWMAQSRSIELIMTGGSIPGIGIISSVLGFILLRTTIVLLLPGFIFSWLCLELMDFLQEKRKPEKIIEKETT
jgi:hypothetical protein